MSTQVALQVRQHHLPLPLNSFVGREHELAEVARQLTANRLLTLTGAGGCGKTRIALEAATQAHYRDGTLLVELAPLADAALISGHVALALGIREKPGHSLDRSLHDWLATRELLLVLDNCEHLVEACASLVAGWLRASPGLKVLATSREPLRVAGEVVRRVPSLSLPAPDESSPRRILDSEAVRLFVDRAQEVRGYSLTSDNAPLVAQICRRLDGMPLAIELAASRIGVLSERDILVRLDDSFALLKRSPRAVSERHQTLQATVDWSHRMLTATERVVFRRLAVFAGWFSLRDADAICVDQEVDGAMVLEAVERLVDTSLVLSESRRADIVSFSLLETLRQYAQTRLVEGGETAATRSKHARWFASVAEELRPQLDGPEQSSALDLLERLQGNFRAALEWAGDEDPALGLGLAISLEPYWSVRGPFSEGSRWLNTMLTREPQPAALRAHGLLAAASLAWRQGDFAAARSWAEEALTAAHGLDDLSIRQTAIEQLSIVLHSIGDLHRARILAEEALELARQFAEDRRSLKALWNMAMTCYFAGDAATTRSVANEYLELAQGVGERRATGQAKRILGLLSFDQGRYSEARTLLAEALRIRQDLHDSARLAYSLEDHALLAFAHGSRERGVRLAGAADALRESIGAQAVEPWRSKVDGWLTSARRAMGGKAFVASWQQGQRMDVDHAVAYALGSQTYTSKPEQDDDRASQLTEREEQVVRLLAGGLTNRQIAKRLAVGERTVDTHVDHVRDKLGLRTRAQIASWATDRGMLS